MDDERAWQKILGDIEPRREWNPAALNELRERAAREAA